MNSSLHRTFGIISAAIVLVAVVWGFVLAGGPASERLRRFDERKLQDLRTMSNTINTIVYDGYAMEPSKEKGVPRALPKTIDEIAKNSTYEKITGIDPQNGEPYEYVVTGKTTYELCAGFNLNRDQNYDVFWNHPEGRYCYKLDVLKPNR